jgi:hypothetical protein
LSIDEHGRVRWTTGSVALGAYPVTLQVRDPLGATATQAYSIQVLPDTTAPSVLLTVNPTTVPLGDLVAVQVQAVDNVGVTKLTLTVNGQPVALSPTGSYTLTAANLGTVNLVASATDASGNIGSDSDSVLVYDATDPDAPEVSLLTPTDGSDVTAPTEVIGRVVDTNLLDWTLTVEPYDFSAPPRIIGHGTDPVYDTVVGTFDPTLLENGSYRVRLTARDLGNHTNTAEHILHVSGALKLGNFRLSVTDFTVPVAGIPITIGRTYDSLRAHRDEGLGYGWQLDIKGATLRANVESPVVFGAGNYPPFAAGDRVTVNLADGSSQEYYFAPEPAGSLIGLSTQYKPVFKPVLPWNQNQLVVSQTEWLLKLGPNTFSAGTGEAYNPFDPVFGGGFELRTRAGMSDRKRLSF